MSTTTACRSATAGLVGGALWALFPVAFGLAALEDVEPGTLSWVAVAASYWLFGVVPPVLIVVGLGALRRSLGDGLGAVGRIGLPVAGAGLAAMAVGNGIEIASLTAGGGEVELGHTVFLLGFLVSIVGGIIVGIVVFRRRTDALSRAAGLGMALALPLGIGLGLLGSAIDPQNDAWFFAAICVPTGIAWLLLGVSLRSARRPATAQFATAS
jgi:hypothetical protein